MGSITLSDPGLEVLQPSLVHGKWGKGKFLYSSRGVAHLYGTGQKSNDEPLASLTCHSSTRVLQYVCWLVA